MRWEEVNFVDNFVKAIIIFYKLIISFKFIKLINQPLTKHRSVRLEVKFNCLHWPNGANLHALNAQYLKPLHKTDQFLLSWSQVLGTKGTAFSFQWFMFLKIWYLIQDVFQLVLFYSWSLIPEKYVLIF